MNDDNKKLYKYLGIFFIVVLLAYKLPHDSYSISQYIIRPISIGNFKLVISGLLPLVVFIIGMKGIFGLEKVKKRGKFKYFILIVVVIMPMMKWSIDYTRIGYHWIKKDGLNSVDIMESDMNIGHSKKELTISIDLELKNYSDRPKRFKLRVYYPKSVSEYIGEKYYEFDDEYYISTHRSPLEIHEKIVIELKDINKQVDLFETEWFWEDMEFELYIEKEVVRIIKHASYM